MAADPSGANNVKRAHMSAALCVDQAPSVQAGPPAADGEAYNQGLVDNGLESVLLSLALGHSLRGSGSRLSTLSLDSIEFLTRIVRTEWEKEQGRAGFMTPPTSPRASSPPKCPMAPPRPSRARLTVLRESGEEGVPRCLFARFRRVEEAPAKIHVPAPSEQLLDSLFGDCDCESG
mmetsp:Transcript_21108/g.48818  ORF Transcript_21108/g.48818 Transcript_21108/m.48818 type:complete len:176 (-) Transcript_21108:405-932(-)